MAEILYSTSGDIREELGNPAEAEYSASDISRARTKATRVVNTYISSVFPDSIPFSSDGDVPLILHSIGQDLSVYYAKRSKHPGPSPLSEDVKEEYWDKSIDLLKMIAKGEITIPELETTRGTSIQAPNSSFIPIFDVDTDLDWAVDPDRTDKIADERND